MKTPDTEKKLDLSGKRFDPLTIEEEAETLRTFHAGTPEARARARDRMVESNLRFVHAVARRYKGRGVPLADLVSEGTIGLCRALERFEADRGFRFLSYAVWWIRQQMMMALAEQGHVISLPPAMMSRLQKIERARCQLDQNLGRLPTLAETAEALDMNTEEVDACLILFSRHYSLEAPAYGEDSEGRLMDAIEDEEAKADASAAEAMNCRFLRKILAALDPQDREIVTRYFGMRTREPENLEAIGSRMGITRERVRQRKVKAFEAMRKRANLLQSGAVQE